MSGRIGRWGTTLLLATALGGAWAAHLHAGPPSPEEELKRKTPDDKSKGLDKEEEVPSDTEENSAPFPSKGTSGAVTYRRVLRSTEFSPPPPLSPSARPQTAPLPAPIGEGAQINENASRENQSASRTPYPASTIPTETNAQTDSASSLNSIFSGASGGGSLEQFALDLEGTASPGTSPLARRKDGGAESTESQKTRAALIAAAQHSSPNAPPNSLTVQRDANAGHQTPPLQSPGTPPSMRNLLAEGRTVRTKRITDPSTFAESPLLSTSPPAKGNSPPQSDSAKRSQPHSAKNYSSLMIRIPQNQDGNEADTEHWEEEIDADTNPHRKSVVTHLLQTVQPPTQPISTPNFRNEGSTNSRQSSRSTSTSSSDGETPRGPLSSALGGASRTSTLPFPVIIRPLSSPIPKPWYTADDLDSEGDPKKSSEIKLVPPAWSPMPLLPGDMKNSKVRPHRPPVTQKPPHLRTRDALTPPLFNLAPPPSAPTPPPALPTSLYLPQATVTRLVREAAQTNTSRHASRKTTQAAKAAKNDPTVAKINQSAVRALLTLLPDPDARHAKHALDATKIQFYKDTAKQLIAQHEATGAKDRSLKEQIKALETRISSDPKDIQLPTKPTPKPQERARSQASTPSTIDLNARLSTSSEESGPEEETYTGERLLPVPIILAEKSTDSGNQVAPLPVSPEAAVPDNWESLAENDEAQKNSDTALPVPLTQVEAEAAHTAQIEGEDPLDELSFTLDSDTDDSASDTDNASAQKEIDPVNGTPRQLSVPLPTPTPPDLSEHISHTSSSDDTDSAPESDAPPPPGIGNDGDNATITHEGILLDTSAPAIGETNGETHIDTTSPEATEDSTFTPEASAVSETPGGDPGSAEGAPGDTTASSTVESTLAATDLGNNEGSGAP